MGILNLTPDSFYDGGEYQSDAAILKQVEKMIEEGADMIDIGAFSSRPNAKLIDEEEEKKRLMGPLKTIRKQFPDVLISIDTYRSTIANEAIYLGADIINDISGGNFDKELPKLLAERGIPYILMHMQGKPDNMQDKPEYEDVSSDIYKWFHKKLLEYRNLGLKDIILDVGFGFGKSLEHNYQLLKDLGHFQSLGCPVLVGLSRKGMIQKIIDAKAENALNGTTAAHVIALMNGANMLRVHDVKAAKEAKQIVDFYQKQ
ncbi:MAG: dihydropteroate synthase [Flavobacteriales bacterium]|nr:dihydropteroate synthase [Flavobacteriales bacterium]